ncbi:MAG: PAS domain-containing protein [Thermodesulfobacteria bacterium]|nr:PAS domain-containing protein [Thermodesulfobacteriota bacterium]
MNPLRATPKQAITAFLVASVVLLSTAVLLYKGMEDLCINRVKETLKFEAEIVSELLQKEGPRLSQPPHKLLLTKLGSVKSRRWIILHDSSGKILWNSLGNSKQQGQSFDPWREREADEKGGFWWIRSKSPKGLFYAITVPIELNQETNYLTLAINARSLSPLTGEFFFVVFWLLLLLILFGILLNKFLSRRSARELSSVMDAVRAISTSTNLNEASERIKSLQRLRVTNHHISALKDMISEGFLMFLHDSQRCRNQLAKLELLFNNMKEAVFLLDERKRVAAMNRSAEEITRVQHNAAEGRPFNVLFRDLKFKELIDQVYREKTDRELELALYTGNEGTEKRYYLVRIVVLRERNGKGLSGVLVVMDDRTRIKRLEESRRRFVANVSHELKTPITAIKGYVETVLDGVDDKETEKHFLSIIARQAERLENLVEDILALSRIEAGPHLAKVELVETRVCDLLRRTLETCRLQAQRKSIELIMECDESLSSLLDPSLMEQAISNLIINAINYSPESTSVVVKAYRQGNFLRIDVIDTGVGIHKKDLEHIFERFYRVDKARSRNLGGTGLGLAIVKHIAQIHRGRVEVVSEPGKGSKFSIILPMASHSSQNGR